MIFIKSLYLHSWFFASGVMVVFLFLLSYFFPALFPFASAGFLILLVLVPVDILLLYAVSGIKAKRQVSKRMSNGDENSVSIFVLNRYQFQVCCKIIDEIPVQFQKRDFSIITRLHPGEEKELKYSLVPKTRGNYAFGNVNVYVTGRLKMIRRRYIIPEKQVVPVYPSFLELKKYELLAITDRLTEAGIKKIRRLGQHTEFDQIREYVKGDDYRTINWKATARKASLMTNQYQDEKSQQVLSIIDKGRVMKMPFEGMTLLDYAINASLVISKIALLKDDKAGLITFNTKIDAFLQASRRQKTIQQILEVLYNQDSGFFESNIEQVYASVSRNISQRSLLILYTNFESAASLKNQLSSLIRLGKSHLLLVILFENTEIYKVIDSKAESTADVYVKTVAEKFMYDKRMIIKELNKYGIHAILTEPQNLTVNLINKYLEFKAVGML